MGRGSQRGWVGEWMGAMGEDRGSLRCRCGGVVSWRGQRHNGCQVLIEAAGGPHLSSGTRSSACWAARRRRRPASVLTPRACAATTPSDSTSCSTTAGCGQERACQGQTGRRKIMCEEMKIERSRGRGRA
jgi:hypothetical protein